MKPSSVAASGVLTFLLFGLINLFQTGHFVAPVPFIGEFIAVICIALLISIQPKGEKVAVGIALLFALTCVLSSSFSWEIILSNIELEQLIMSGWIDILRVLKLLFLTILFLLLVKKGMKPQLKVVGITLLVVYLLFVFLHPSQTSFLSFVGPIVLGVFPLLQLRFEQWKEMHWIGIVFLSYGLLHAIALISMVLA